MSAEREPYRTIARVRTDFPSKFGVPRQAGMVPELTARVVLEPDFRDPAWIRGIEGFSHLWLVWEFSLSTGAHSSTVRPPRLRGARMGVFATRAPLRPNPIGLSSVRLERVEGYSQALIKLHRVEEKDTVLVISNSGRNAVPVEMCLAAKAKGAKVIAMTSMQHSTGCTSRHSSGKKMYEIADVTIDNHVEPGDAAFPIEGLDTPIGPTSSIVGITIAQALVCQVVDNLVKAGIEPPVFKSSNVDGGDALNEHLYETYYGYFK